MSSTSRTSPPRLLEQMAAVAPWRARLALASSGVWAALQAVGLSFAVVALFAVVVVLDAPSTSGTDGGLSAGVGVATGLWLLAHGVPLSAGAATVTLVPLGLTALLVFTAHVSAKRSAAPTLAAWLGGTVLYTGAVVALTVALDLAGTAAPDGVGGLVVQVGAAVLGGLVVGGGGMALGMFSAPDGPLLAGITPRLDPWLPDTLRLGLRAGLVGVALLVGLAAVLVGVWVVTGRDAVAQVADGLGGSWLGVTLLVVVQLVLVPNLVVWASAWIAGPGFAVGTGSAFTTAGSHAEVLPAVPLLGALPGDAWSPSVAVWAPVLVVACGAAAGWFAWRNLEPGLVGGRDVAWILAGTTLSAGATTVLLQWLAGGAAGAGRLADVGADPWVTGGVVAAEVGGGAAVVLVAAWAVEARRRAA
ncbi:DUF6350 family protein [Isoptericola jiangsuensis]|uniref:cell division protein PerM n=1 Tax=Isoptericola jiangsuensis TaxID=548579 RepID=UPI000BF2DC27|nr:DUF6350 family protein [Isoptericola jiangsuensis]